MNPVEGNGILVVLAVVAMEVHHKPIQIVEQMGRTQHARVLRIGVVVYHMALEILQVAKRNIAAAFPWICTVQQCVNDPQPFLLVCHGQYTLEPADIKLHIVHGRVQRIQPCPAYPFLRIMENGALLDKVQ